MGRNRGFTGALIQIQREAERQARLRAATETRAAREAERALRAYERAEVAEAKERQRLYVESRMADVELLNEELKEDVAALELLLRDTLAVDDFLEFEALNEAAPLPSFTPMLSAHPSQLGCVLGCPALGRNISHGGKRVRMLMKLKSPLIRPAKLGVSGASPPRK